MPVRGTTPASAFVSPEPTRDPLAPTRSRNRRAGRLTLIHDRSPRESQWHRRESPLPNFSHRSPPSPIAATLLPPPRKPKRYAQSIHQPRTIACRCAQRGRVNAQQGRCPLNPRRFLTARVNRSISDFHVELSLLAAIVFGPVA